MSLFLLHALLGTAVSLIVFLLLAYLSKESFSLPMAPLLVGLFCGVLAYYLSPWATPLVVFLYTMASINEYRQGRSQTPPK